MFLCPGCEAKVGTEYDIWTHALLLIYPNLVCFSFLFKQAHSRGGCIQAEPLLL